MTTTIARPVTENVNLEAFAALDIDTPAETAHSLHAETMAEDLAELQAEMDAAYWEEVWWEELFDPVLGY
jgi:hypothetical protein